MIFDCKVAFINAMNTIREYYCTKNHGSGVLEMKNKFGILKINTINTTSDQHARTPMSGLSARENLVASIIS